MRPDICLIEMPSINVVRKCIVIATWQIKVNERIDFTQQDRIKPGRKEKINQYEQRCESHYQVSAALQMR